MSVAALLWIGIIGAIAGVIWMWLAGPSNAAWSGFVLMVIGLVVEVVAIVLWGVGLIS